MAHGLEMLKFMSTNQVIRVSRSLACFRLDRDGSAESTQYAITGFAMAWDFAAATLLVKESGGKVMVLGSNQRFVEFDGWSSGYANDSATYGRIRKWQGLLLSGSPATVDFVSANLKPKRKGLLGKLASLVGS